MQALLKLMMNKVVALVLSLGTLLSIMTGGLVKIPDGVLPEIPDDPPAAQVEIYPGAVRAASFNVQTAGEGENFFLFRIRAVAETIKNMRPIPLACRRRTPAGWSPFKQRCPPMPMWALAEMVMCLMNLRRFST